MDSIIEHIQSAFYSIYNKMPHHPVFLISFAVFTFWKVYCTLCVVIEHFKIRKYQSKIVLIIGYEEKSHARLLTVKCVKKGMRVLVACRTQEALHSLKGTAINGPGTVEGFLLNSTNDASVLELKLKIQDELIAKGKELFAIVNCPGPSLTIGNDDWLSMEDYESSFKENFFALIRVVHAFKPMLKASRGRIINLTTVYGKFGLPGLGAHCLSDSCTEVYSDVLRRELQPFGVKTIVVQGGFLRGAGKVEAAFKSMWAKTSEQVKDAYGGDEYQQKGGFDSITGIHFFFLSKGFPYNRLEILVLAQIKSKENSIFHCPLECWTTSCMFNALTSAWPRRRYVLGFANVLFYTPISCLPANFQDLFLRIYVFLKWFPRPIHTECCKQQKVKKMGSIASEC